MGNLFGISLKASKSKQTTAQNSSSTSTTTQIAPEWETSLVQGASGRVASLLDQDPQNFVAPANPLQNQAATGAANLNNFSAGYGEAADAMRGVGAAGASTYDATSYDPQGYRATSYRGATVAPIANATAGSLLDNIESYMSPYRHSVVDAALKDYEYGAGQTRAQQDLDLAGSGAFGGSGAALTKSMTEDNLVRGRATTSANLLDQMFNRGAALSNLDADRRTQVSMGNAGAANSAALSQAQLDQQAGLARSQNLNEASRYRADAFNKAAEFSADARNAAGRFNAGQSEAALNRQLAAARGLSDVYTTRGETDRANINAQAGIGATMRAIDQESRQAAIMTTDRIVAMVNGLPFHDFVGSQTNKTESSTGTTKTKGIEVGASASIQG